jgi:predicted acyltransferase
MANESTTGAPDATESRAGKPPRLVSLDALRGFDMVWIAGADALGHAAAGIANGPITHALAEQLEHVPWEGFRFYDLIFPLFVFMSGMSLVFSLGGKLAAEGKDAAILRLGRRALILYLLGIFYYRGFTGWENDIRYMGVLQRIALTYFFAGTLYLLLKPRQLLYALAGILLGYWALLALVPVPGVGPANFKPDTNLAHWVDATFLGGKKWNGAHDPEGLLSTIPAIGTCLLGVFAGLLMNDPQRTPMQRIRWLAAAGVSLLVLGFTWGLAFPIIKGIWTSSYVCVAGGWSALLLALFYWLIDVRGWSGWARPFVWIGMNSIAVYLASNLFDFGRLARRLTGGEVATLADTLVAPGAGDLLNAIVGVGFCVWLAWLLHRRKIFLRV